MPAAGIPGVPGMPAGTASGAPAPGPTAVVQPPPANVAPAGFATWAAVVQLCGTDNLPTSSVRAVTADTAPRPGEPAGAGVDTMLINPGILDPPPGGTGNPGVRTSLMSAIADVTAGVTIAGFTYPPEVNPLKKLEFKKSETGFPGGSGDASECSAVGVAEIS